MKTSADILRELREDRDLNQKELGKIVGASQQQYSCYETGVSELPIRTLHTLADYYGISSDYILGRTQCMQGIDVLNQEVIPNHTAGQVLSDLLTLDKEGRMFVLECLSLRKEKGGKN